MILQALNSYYHRLKNDDAIDIPLFGFSREKIHFAFIINPNNGELCQILDLRTFEGKKPSPKELIVPKPAKRSGKGFAPNFLWDNTGYVLGADSKGDIDRTNSMFSHFKAFQHKIGDHIDDSGIKALLMFLDAWHPDQATQIENWKDISGQNIVFQLDGELEFLHDRPKIKQAWIDYSSEQLSDINMVCLVSGKKSPIARLHPDIKGVKNAQTKGATLVGFNLDAFKSYGKDQSYNAPVSEAITFNYGTALNYLLRFNSPQKIQIGDATTVFWTEQPSILEGFLGLIFDFKEDATHIKDVRDYLDAVKKGRMPRDIENDRHVPFYILGLAPNASRLSVRFWHASTVDDINIKIAQHFNDLSIDKRSNNDPDYPPMWMLLKETAAVKKLDNVSPMLAGAMMRSILTGSAYPQSLLMTVIHRIRADQDISYFRAAMIKACLVRKFRLNNILMEVGMSLNKESTNIAYRLGRLFAALEKAQKDAIQGIKSTIKDRYYGSASATPRAVFPQLLRLTQHHIQKAEYGHVIDKKIEEIMQEISEFPAHLSLENQGLFALGYYHQRPEFYKKLEKKED